MTTDRHAYKIDPSNPGSDLAGETAAAMAAASIVFRHSNPSYSAELLCHAYQLFDFANRYRGKYDNSITVAQKYYRSISGYNDELLWAAAWLYQASNNQYYLDYLGRNGDSMGGTSWGMSEFGWDVKYARVQTLVAKFLMQGKTGHNAAVFEKYQQKVEYFMCSSFLATVYSDYLASSRRNLRCSSANVAPAELLNLAKSQVDYILGDNPRAASYMVNPSFVSCRGGYATWFSSKKSDPNQLTGALVGGPDAYDNFADERDNYEQTEPAIISETEKP
ncbi:Endoglucanase [Stylosanthes scabra]|uniref:cellulase n=1 Tax=Stylosanthes scabra TaxID=79078 RepID=A0ABU6QUU8_9FABA|nr:Endoglucanase [Stylosanthes scabra]